MRDELSLDVGDNKETPALARAEAVTLYRGEERLKGWDDEIKPADFLVARCAAEETEGGVRASISGWGGMIAGLVMVFTLAWWLGNHGQKVSDYFTGLFGPKPQAISTDLSLAPVPLPVSKAPAGFKNEVEAINMAIEKEQWNPAVAGASAIEKDESSLARFKDKPEAFIWLYECLVAGEMQKEYKDGDAVLRAANSFEAEGGKPTFRILYNKMLALFELRGGTMKMKDGNDDDYLVLSECALIQDQFGVEVTAKQKRVEKLRTVRMFSLIRILDGVEDLEDFNKESKDGKTFSYHWETLDDLITASRGTDIPSGNDEELIVKKWKEMAEDHLRCEEWFWAKIEDLEPFWGSEVNIGGKKYDGDDAEDRKDLISEALK